MEYQNLDLLVSTIKERGFKAVCIQSTNTNASISVCNYLQDVFKSDSTVKFYILGDILTGSCCLDVVATKRFQTDCLVYVGDGCYFELDVPNYVFYLYSKLPLQLEPIAEKISGLCSSLEFDSVLYIYSSSVHHIVNEVSSIFRKNRRRFYVANVGESKSDSDDSGTGTVMVCNRVVYEHTTDCSSPDKVTVTNGKKIEGNKLLVLYLSESEDEAMAKLIGLSVCYTHFYQIIVGKKGEWVNDSDNNHVNGTINGMNFGNCQMLDRCNLCNKYTMKRYSMVEKAQQATNFGIIAVAKSFKGGIRLRQQLQKLLTQKGKAYWLFSVNHLTEAKLLNFPKVEVWILLSCNLTPLSLPRELEKMLMYPYELLVALGVLEWGTYTFRYDHLAEAIDKYLENWQKAESEKSEEAASQQLSRLKNMELREKFETLYEKISSNDDRTFKGVDPDFYGNIRVIKGSRGTASKVKKAVNVGNEDLNLMKIRKDVKLVDGKLRGVHFEEQHKSENKFVPHPFNRRFAFSKRPLFPIEPRNLRIYGLLRHKKRGIGKKSNARGIRKKNDKNRGRKPNSRTFEGGQSPLYTRLPKYPEAILSKFDKKYDQLNLCKLRYFIERGRLDVRFPITQRHLHDSKCVKVKNGVHLFNVNNYPFPYKIDIVVASCDQSSVDVIKKVGGTVSIIHYDKIALRAHIKPYKYEILPKTARPDIKRVYELEKLRLMGCNVIYIKPLWLIKEEERLMQEFKELYQHNGDENFDELILKYRKQLLQEQV
ncbi:ribosomal protein L15 [Theileria orientalis strain Shintoku]|uniref:Ribosomal protein L15 n=1 Tax=Theileria orientalis strain Shintoku TaxID=869250 RepID=J4D5V3_THEOR|nr:ribosomal protein L15 [Theileria orientalis strain Shintoku]BAM39195.1 ribosomal protein L15 [Theileria orientalis strain Shintoku]|eukprot:XP_009689496.1 ribosomal protein L15 [Theileria orientalis strain Shintoku]